MKDPKERYRDSAMIHCAARLWNWWTDGCTPTCSIDEGKHAFAAEVRSTALRLEYISRRPWLRALWRLIPG